MRQDFLQLYAELRVQPDCKFDEFRQAYRRRVAALHPDKQPAGTMPVQAEALLGELTALYAKADRFHRRYGRLPGAISNRSQRHTPPRTTLPIPRSRPPSEPPAVSRGLKFAALLIVLLLVLLLSWDWPTPSSTLGSEVTDSPYHGDVASTMTNKPVNTMADRLALGMDANTVLAIQGSPEFNDGNRWDYGPSWVKFEDGRVVDWYSSPLRRLKSDYRSPDSPARLR